MARNPTYEELEQRVQALEIEILNNKQTIKELKEKEAEAEEYFNLENYMMCIADLKGNFLKVSGTFKEILGYTAEELLSQPYLNFVHSEDKEKTVKLIENELSSGKKIISFENRYMCKDGSYKWLSWTGHPNTEKGVSYSIAHDITERKKTEEMLKESESKYREITESIPGMVFRHILHPDGSSSVPYVSSHMTETHGLKPEDIKANPSLLFKPIHPDDRYLVDENINKLASELISTSFDHRVIDKNGEIKWFHVESKPKKLENGDIILDSISLDITKEKILEQQLKQSQKLESIGTLAGGIAHDFNNILYPIMLHAEMLMEELSPDDPSHHSIKEIYKAVKRARDIVQQMLTFARKSSEEKIVLKSSSIIKEAINFLRTSIPTTIDIQFNNKAQQDTVLAEPTQLNQIIMNLCTNAAHAMKEKGGILEVIMDNVDISLSKANTMINLKPGKYLKLTVKDNGTGISPDIKSKIFEPYFTTKGVGEGTGFGLATVLSIVQSYGGDITVASETGKGSTFEVYIPLEKSDTQDLKEERTEIQTGTESILFIDDETPIVNAMKRSLEKFGYKVTGRTSSVEALETFRNDPSAFDLIITDMTMPNMTGEELTRELRVIKPGIPVILCTGFSDKINDKKVEKMGISSLVMKPATGKEIAVTIRKVLDNN